MKSYWVYPKNAEWKMLAFAETEKQARKLAYKHSPVFISEAPYILWRAKRADDKWIKFYKGIDVILTMPGMEDITWEQWYDIWEAENETG